MAKLFTRYVSSALTIPNTSFVFQPIKFAELQQNDRSCSEKDVLLPVALGIMKIKEISHSRQTTP